MKKPAYYVLGYAPYVALPQLGIYQSKLQANMRAKDERRIGQYRGWGIKVYRCNAEGQIQLSS